jgi:hypothetical protein
MTKAAFALALVSAGTMLGGCQQIHSMFAGRPAHADTAAIDMSSYFVVRLEAGKQHLREHRLAQAVTAFRQASYDPATAAEAYNGMAIAYAELGREDLAKRYFMAALQADPTDERFTRNLARLDGSMPSAAPAAANARVDLPQGVELPPVAPVAALAAPPTAALATGAPSYAVARTVAREVPVAKTYVPVPHRAAEVRVSRVSADRPVAVGRVTIEGPRRVSAQPPAYPVRVVLADVADRSPQAGSRTN